MTETTGERKRPGKDSATVGLCEYQPSDCLGVSVEGEEQVAGVEVPQVHLQEKKQCMSRQRTQINAVKTAYGTWANTAHTGCN